MIHKTILLILPILILFSCQNQNIGLQSEDKDSPKEIYLSDLIEIDQIDSVLMNNNYGSHLIPISKLEEFKSKLGNTRLDEGSYKVGAITFSIYIKGNQYHFSGRTHGNFIEIHSDFISKNKAWINQKWLYFNASDINLDNY
jgi:hypothetical protein